MIPARHGDAIVEIAVSPEDYSVFMARPIRVTSNGYVGRSYYDERAGKSTTVEMHRVVARARKGDIIDHIKGNLRDLRRCALRKATHSQNSANKRLRLAKKSSPFRGVTLHKKTGRWQAGYKHRDVFHHLGLFESEVDAARAYNRAAVQVWGVFAVVNDLPAQKRDAQARAA